MEGPAGFLAGGRVGGSRVGEGGSIWSHSDGRSGGISRGWEGEGVPGGGEGGSIWSHSEGRSGGISGGLGGWVLSGVRAGM